MRKHTILLAAAPLALLTACGDGADEAEGYEADATTIADAENDPTAAEDDYTPGPATRLSDAGDYSGGYTYTSPNGTEYELQLNSEDKTYKWFGPNGLERTGDYTWTPDGFRIMIDEFDGGPAWFTLREGSLIRLREDREITPEIEVDGERYRRDDSNAVFSRDPELGSMVVPMDD
ncbi:hypothetical protein [Qipengyuania nanhaisediminis]|uniref:hypothetical protein n=1 Tax=Qipengyuania nanhaisediminis TaxID=604088 RepID=UPI0038B3445A